MIKLGRLFKSFRYAFKGLIKIFHEEQNLRLQAAGGLAAIALGAYFRLERWEWGILTLAISLVLLMEIANSAIERVTDILKPRLDGLVKEIKDIMAAAVMLASFAAIVVGCLIFLPRLF